MTSDRENEAAPTPTLCEYAGDMLTRRLTRMLSHCQGVRDGLSNEPVHQMRVWSRRTRAALELFHSCVDGNALFTIEREIKRVADALGEARDLDVMIETMHKVSFALPELQRPGVLAMIDNLVRDRAECQTAVDRAVARVQRCELGAVLEKIVPAPQPPVPLEVRLAGSIS